MTLSSWNIENLPRFLGPAPGTPSLAQIVDAWGAPEIVCLQETRIRPRDTELVRAMERALPGYACHFSLCDDPRNATYRGGRAYGVVTYVVQKVGRARGRTLPWDREGRVVVVELAKQKLAIVNVYAVNGTSRPYFDHELNDEIIPALDVVDAFRALHPTAKKYTWFNNHARRLDAARVDYALVSRTLGVSAADIDETRAHRFGSDHAPLWIAIDV